jgi:hypothetical protein
MRNRPIKNSARVVEMYLVEKVPTELIVERMGLKNIHQVHDLVYKAKHRNKSRKQQESVVSVNHS